MDVFVAPIRWLGWIALCLISLTAITQPIHAQTLTDTTPVSGVLAAGEMDRYTVIAREGQLLSVTVRGSDGLDPLVTLRDVNGGVLLVNDDYDYPATTDARLEGFTAPYTGSYTLEISPYGSTSGAYELEFVTGYSERLLAATFDTDGDWTLADTSGETSGSLEIVNGTANLSQTGIGQPAIASGITIDRDAYYIDVAVDSITGAQGWRAGLIFKYTNADNFYRLLVNNSGAWRMERVQNGESTLLRNWNTHPAIAPGTTRFRLGVLVNGTQYDVFYDGQYIGTERDDALESGAVGLALITAESLGSSVTVRYDNVTVSTPAFSADAVPVPQQIVATGTNATVRELEHRLLIPPAGELVLSLSDSFAQNVNEGVSRFPLGGDLTLTNGLVAATVSWPQGTESNGCGLVLRDEGGSERYLLAFIDNDGGYGLALRDGDRFTDSVYQNTLDLTRPPYQIVIVAIESRVYLYIDGQHAVTLDVPPISGGVGMAVVNFEAASTTCEYRNLWIWRTGS